MTLRVMPFVEKLVIDYLLSIDELVDLVGDGGIGTVLPAARPFVRVSRVGGSEAVREWLDAPRIQFEAYADDQAEAWQVAALVRAAVQQIDRVQHDEGVVTAATVLLGPVWLPDPPTDRPRYILDVQLHVHPHPASTGS